MSTTTVTGRRRQIIEARQLFQRVLEGDLRARAEVMETMTTSDFPVLLGAAYGRELIQEYQAAPSVWTQFATRRVVPDFRKRKLVELLGGRAGLDKVKEGGEYEARSVSESEREFSVEKYGDRFPLTWEMLVNDDLDAFRSLPNRLAVAARETEDIAAAKPLFNAGGSGLNSDFFKTANSNAVDNKPLTSENVEAALVAIAGRKDEDQRPVVIPTGRLMVPPELEMAGRRVLEASEIRRTDATGNVVSIEQNYLRGRLTLVVNPWLSLAAPSFSGLPRTWFILPDPNSPRPAVAAGFLRGNETPDLRVKADAGNRVGGGALAPEEGSFDDDTVQYRVRHVTGGAALIPTATYVSTGPTG